MFNGEWHEYAELKEEIGITERNKEKIKEAKYFIKLYKRNWKVISNSAIKQLQERQFNQEIQLPTGDEIKELKFKLRNGGNVLEKKDDEFEKYRMHTEEKFLTLNKEKRNIIH